MKESLFHLIFDNFEKSDKYEKLLSFKNKIFRKHFFSSLNCKFTGEILGLEIINGKGAICQDNNIFSGKWENKIINKGEITRDKFDNESFF